LFLSHIEGTVIDSFTLFYGYFEGVDNLDLTAILGAEESTKN
jgi:hypothetical protein